MVNVPSLGELRKLQILHLQDNRIDTFPDVSACSALRELSISANQIKVKISVSLKVFNALHQNN